MFKFCDPTENTSNRNLKRIFPLTDAYRIITQQAHHANPKKWFIPPPPTHNQSTKFTSRKLHSLTQQLCVWRLVTHPEALRHWRSPRPGQLDQKDPRNPTLEHRNSKKTNVMSSEVIDLSWPRKGGGINENHAFPFAVTVRVRITHKTPNFVSYRRWNGAELKIRLRWPREWRYRSRTMGKGHQIFRGESTWFWFRLAKFRGTPPVNTRVD